MACHIGSFPNPQPKCSRERRYNIIMKRFIYCMSHRFTPQLKCSCERQLQHYHNKIDIWHVTSVHSPLPNVRVKGTYNIIMTRFIYGMSHLFTTQPKCSRERRYNIIIKIFICGNSHRFTPKHNVQMKSTYNIILTRFIYGMSHWFTPNPNVYEKGTYNIIMTRFICGMSHWFTPQPKCSRERHLQHYHDKIYIWHVTLVHSQTHMFT